MMRLLLASHDEVARNPAAAAVDNSNPAASNVIVVRLPRGSVTAVWFVPGRYVKLMSCPIGTTGSPRMRADPGPANAAWMAVRPGRSP